MPSSSARKATLLVFGRKTYEGMAAYWPSAESEDKIKAYMNGIAKIAVSRTMEKADWNNTRVVNDPVSELKRLKDRRTARRSSSSAAPSLPIP